MPMIQVNLLPSTYRRPEASSVMQLARSPLALIVLALMAAVVGILVVVSQMRQAQLAQLELQLRQVSPKRASVEQLMQSVQSLRDQKALLERVLESRSQWARHLNQLSNVTPEGVWFTDLLMNTDKGLVIQGAAIGQGGSEMVQIGRLAQDLKADPAFSAVVRDIQIQSIESVQDRETEVVKFTLTGALVNTGAAGGP